MFDYHHIVLCKKQIEKKLYPDHDSVKLKQRDFNYLSVLIEEASGIVLSLSTLKRLWANDVKQPHPATLNALVSILGYKEWNDFKQDYPVQTNLAKKANQKSTNKLLPYVLIIILAFTGFLYWSFTREETKNSLQVNGTYNFTANKTVTSGIPNTVIFDYDLSNVEADSFFIQQSWNERNKEVIEQNGQHFTSIYYYPGFHRAKLIANDSILTTHRIHITTNDWEAYTVNSEFQDIPFYLNGQIKRDGILQASDEQIINAKTDVSKPYILVYNNVKDFGDLQSTDFQFKTRVRCDSTDIEVCSSMEIRLLCEDHIFYLGLIEPGCVSKVGLKVGDKYIDGKTNDLSGFGVDVNQWNDFEIKVENKKTIIQVNNEPVLETTFDKGLGKIVGLVIGFNGKGFVDEVSLKNGKGEMVYNDTF